MGAVALVAATANPGGTAATSSPWLAQTRSSAGISRNSAGASPLPLTCHESMAEFAMAGASHLPAQHIGHQLHAVADAEHRHAELEHARVAFRRASF